MSTTLNQPTQESATELSVADTVLPVDGGRRARRLAAEAAAHAGPAAPVPVAKVTSARRPVIRIPRPSRRTGVIPPAWSFATSALTGVAVLTLGFVVLITVGSSLQAGRDQQVLYSQLREQLANAVAPVSAVTAEGSALEPGAPVAILSIPQVGVDHVVVEGTASADTMSGPGHRRDTVLPGQAGVSVVFGRQAAYGGPFGRIGELAVGDEFTATTGQGIATFRVDDVRRAGDPQPTPLEPGAGRLTLTSAAGTPYLPDATIRVDASVVSTSVDGIEQTEGPFPASARGITAASLPASERAMGTDSSQLFALVLWAQLFLICVLAFTWARERWGRWQAWTVGLPVLIAVGWAVSGQLTLLLPNLI